MIVRERPDSFVLVRQHDHALASGELARYWAERPRPYEPAVFAVTNHDVAWKGPDSSVRWNEDAHRPYSFVDYPAEEKAAAYTRGLDWLESEDAYAACLCSMHYERLMREFGRSGADARFAGAESRRQGRLRQDIGREELDNLERNLGLLRLCDGLSLFVCLNEPGSSSYPPPYPGGFRFDGETFEPVWVDPNTLRLDPNPFSGPFGISIPYEEVDRAGEPMGSGRIEVRVTF
ncbi:MAG: DUF3891 family protein [Rubrobacteraceae bacterium]